MIQILEEKNKERIMTVEQKLVIAKFCPDTESHIRTNPYICILCKGKECTKFCPANVFAWSVEDNELIVGYENCLECGACKMGCPYEAIDYTHPRAGYGVL